MVTYMESSHSITVCYSTFMLNIVQVEYHGGITRTELHGSENVVCIQSRFVDLYDPRFVDLYDPRFVDLYDPHLVLLKSDDVTGR